MTEQQQLDAAARAKGFPDYATWAAWNANRTAAVKNPTAVAQPQAAPVNWLQSLLQRIPIHPAALFSKIDEKYSKATGQKK